NITENKKNKRSNEESFYRHTNDEWKGVMKCIEDLDNLKILDQDKMLQENKRLQGSRFYLSEENFLNFIYKVINHIEDRALFPNSALITIQDLETMSTNIEFYGVDEIARSIVEDVKNLGNSGIINSSDALEMEKQIENPELTKEELRGIINNVINKVESYYLSQESNIVNISYQNSTVSHVLQQEIVEASQNLNLINPTREASQAMQEAQVAQVAPMKSEQDNQIAYLQDLAKGNYEMNKTKEYVKKVLDNMTKSGTLNKDFVSDICKDLNNDELTKDELRTIINDVIKEVQNYQREASSLPISRSNSTFSMESQQRTVELVRPAPPIPFSDAQTIPKQVCQTQGSHVVAQQSTAPNKGAQLGTSSMSVPTPQQVVATPPPSPTTSNTAVSPTQVQGQVGHTVQSGASPVLASVQDRDIPTPPPIEEFEEFKREKQQHSDHSTATHNVASANTIISNKDTNTRNHELNEALKKSSHFQKMRDATDTDIKVSSKSITIPGTQLNDSSVQQVTKNKERGPA
ncbi:hypothetical protein, partial [Wolbachia endosymbiont of Pentidionis agamae]|uniref:hypothetical protein n=1 Tax=Wolbachia endosymbiont of Pentidionis agamae TaxID=3110435 RepID=UPI002FD7036B